MKNKKSLSIMASFLGVFVTCSLAGTMEVAKGEIDKVIEDELTHKLGEDLLQSIERKFQVDLERSVDLVLIKIKMLLQNGTVHIQDRLAELQDLLDGMKQTNQIQVEQCLVEQQNATAALAEKALHQMVVCGYALIGHDPAHAVRTVIALKDMIKQGLMPIYEQKRELYGSLKTCGHNHESLKKVIKCVISKSPLIKTAMMEVTGKLIEGVVDLTKLLAHGAMHEACLIEVIKTVEDAAFDLIAHVRKCVYHNDTTAEVESYLLENNATILDIDNKKKDDSRPSVQENIEEVQEMKDLIRRMLTDKGKELDKRFKRKLIKLQQDLKSVDTNDVAGTAIKDD
ncbi:uncharacterized protein LOC115447907 isoform X2 [Manduca sexta]|uniref:Secreted protein n=1 Tax=Manduca sexta TaxID=7130 RepID=A0A922CT00_MANSE|nr:uncharacterized protein LOC115447907 isoform X2 [Manduca sexta]KAG6457026.1 hypothetical protein O3G_MSEX010076 [Manduca sexta]